MRSVPLPSAILACLLVMPAGASPSRIGLVSFRRVPIPDDVPAHLCTALAQDREGFLWMGTQAGLVRFDGYSFRVHRSDPEDPHTLGGSYVRTLLAASDGRLWAGTFSGGLSVYDPATEAFKRYRHDKRDPGSLSHDRVEGLAEDRSGRLWVATYEGLDRLDPRTGRIDHFRHDPGNPRSLADDRVRALLVDRRGQVWVGGRDGLQVWREGKGFERVAPGLAGQFVGKLFEDSRGRIWIGTTENGAAVFDPPARSWNGPARSGLLPGRSPRNGPARSPGRRSWTSRTSGSTRPRGAAGTAGWGSKPARPETPKRP